MTDQRGKVRTTSETGRVRVIAFYSSDFELPRGSTRATGRGASAAPGEPWLVREVRALTQSKGVQQTQLLSSPQLARQLPDPVWVERVPADRVQLSEIPEAPGEGPAASIAFTEVVSYLFQLEVPDDQAVMAIEFTLDPQALAAGDAPLRTLLRYLASAELMMPGPDGDDLTLTEYVLDRLRREGWLPPHSRAAAPSTADSEYQWLAVERHQLILIEDWEGTFPQYAETSPGTGEPSLDADVGGVTPDMRKRWIVHRLRGSEEDLAQHDLTGLPAGAVGMVRSGADIRMPIAMNIRPGHWCGVLAQRSLVVGRHSDPVIAGLCLTVVQAIGTGARFQAIWNRAFEAATRFQEKYQDDDDHPEARHELERLADDLGDLEFQLAFNVGTAADLGLRLPSSRIDDFHHALYEATELRQRVLTVGQMFIQARNSVHSELTAIESREVRAGNQRTRILDLTYAATGLIVAWLALVLAYLGVSTTDVKHCTVPAKTGTTATAVTVTCDDQSAWQALTHAPEHGWPLLLFVLPALPLGAAIPPYRRWLRSVPRTPGKQPKGPRTDRVDRLRDQCGDGLVFRGATASGRLWALGRWLRGR